MSRFDLIIFDCDGVLVDSERLLVRTDAKILVGLGWPLSEAEIVARFVGRSDSYIQEQVEQQIGRPIDWGAEFETPHRTVCERELMPIPGVSEALDAITTLTCVGSNSSHASLQRSLGATGLLPWFLGRIFSSSEVEHPKPAPDVFLYAARMLGVPARRCAVVEDSVPGVVAGVAAGMTVFGFSGSVTSEGALTSAGAVAFGSMRDLPGHVLEG
ncbi:MAG: HAD family hydrolase [Acidimicrobiales bacterium]